MLPYLLFIVVILVQWLSNCCWVADMLDC